MISQVTSRPAAAQADRPSGRHWSAEIERKTPQVLLGVPRGRPQRSGGQAPEADALSAELQARDRAPVRRREAGLYSLRPPEDPETSKRLPKEPLRTVSYTHLT